MALEASPVYALDEVPVDGVDHLPTAVELAFDSAPSAEPTAEPPAASSEPAATAQEVPRADAPPKPVTTSSDVRDALRRFYARTVWTEEDQSDAWKRRGLCPYASIAFGLRSNRPENAGVIEELIGQIDHDVLLRAGLVERVQVEGDSTGVRPARNLCGFGEVTKVKLKGRNRATVESEMRKRYEAFAPITFWVSKTTDELHVYGMNRAPIIPYFDYIPSAPESNYDLVLVTEGEFKAMALWQTYAEELWSFSNPNPDNLIGLRTHKMWAAGAKPDAFMTPVGGGSIRWRGRQYRIGFVAVPGIQFVMLKGDTWKVAHEVRQFITRNGARDAIVVFDNEDKGNPKLPGYNQNVERRFDAVAYALVLARNLSKSFVHGHFGMIPDSFRDAKGKADFDGAIRSMINESLNA